MGLTGNTVPQSTPPVFPAPVFPGQPAAPTEPSNRVATPSPPGNRRPLIVGGIVAVVIMTVVVVGLAVSGSGGDGPRSSAEESAGPLTETVSAAPLLPPVTQSDRDVVEQSLRRFYGGLAGNGASGAQVCGIFQTLWEDVLRDQNFRIDYVDGVDISTTSAYVDYTVTKFRPGMAQESLRLTTLLKNEGGVWKWCGSATR